MLPGVALTLLTCVGLILPVIADTTCSATVPCALGCCGEYGVCGMGPDYCGSDVCINNCDAKAECNPGGWASEYVNATTCPLDVCCSQYGFCGTTEEFCGNKTVTAPSCDVSTQSITRVIGYYSSAGASRACDGMAPYSVPQGVYSHIYFAFGSIDPDTFEVIPAETSDEALYAGLAALQLRDPDQELWLSIGGWDFTDSGEPTATTFSDLAAAGTTEQNAFFKSLINFMSTYGFTGVDIDWEYPVASDRNGRAEDYENYPTFLASLKQALSDYKYGLSITLPTSYWYLQNFDLTAIEPSVDWFNVMSYDLHGTWDMTDIWVGPYLDAHTNLTDIKSALDLLWGVNITASKVTLGMAFYGRSYTIESPSCSEPGCQYLSAGTAGNCSQSAGILFNSEIEALISDQNLTSTLYTDAAVKTITWDNDQWVSYDDEETWKLKADYAKSVCIGGVMVWSIDEDDDVHTFSNGLAAALGNTVNLNSSTTSTDSTSPILDTTQTTTVYRQDNYCRFINCGEICPNGFSDIVREDNKKQIMLDSTECLPGADQTQTLCCPTSSTLPTCQWRGFNGGACRGGCDSGEAEVGTITAGCRSGYQSACCTITDSTEPWSECAWTSSCESDDTCASGFDTFVVGSRQGWGGRKLCPVSENYNYCCKTSIPDAFTNCAWTGHEVQFINPQYCSDTCPSGAIRVAEEAVMGSNWYSSDAKTPNCLWGNEAYCCNGTAQIVSTVEPRSPSTVLTGVAYEFDFYLKKWLANPTCSVADNEYVATFGKRDLYERSSSTSTVDDDFLFALLVNYIVTWVTTSSPDPTLTTIWINDMTSAGYATEAANLTTIRDVTYGYGDPWTGTPVYPAPIAVAQMLCNIAESQTGMESLAVANDILCELPSSSSVSKRMLVGISDNLRSANGDQPTILAALRGITSGDLAFHYGRWLSTPTPRNGVPDVILELAFWLGRTPGVAPNAGNLTAYGDSDDTVQTDRWIIMHLHIPRDRNTFAPTTTGAGGLGLGVRAMGLYHSQTLHRIRNQAPRAEWRFSQNYAGGADNTGALQNYNARTQALRCRSNARWYAGIDSTVNLQRAQTSGLPVEYAEAVNAFGLWLVTQGILSNTMLGRIWPIAGEMGQEAGTSRVNPPSGATNYDPTSNAFTVNWNAAGGTVNVVGSTSVYT
ncbi:Glycoside hydrolase superfamily [Penicillium sp. IBT 16267x]|nr:Glycoside hydrolase superfamily [Penicillium sp. IBT 16267x]